MTSCTVVQDYHVASDLQLNWMYLKK